MKISLTSAMAQRIAIAQEKINAQYAVAVSALDAIHVRKREIATAVKAGETPPDSFAQEASLRSITPEQLADIVLSKPCPITAADERELKRQRMLLAVAAATTPDAIDAVLAGLTA